MYNLIEKRLKIKEYILKKNIDIKLLLLLLLVIIIESFNNVFFKRWTSQMSNYIWFIGTIINPLIFGILIWIYILIMYIFGKIPKNKLIYKPKIFLICAIFDTVSSLLAVISSPYISVGIQLVLRQINIVLTIIYSVIFLKKKYTYIHYLSSFLIIYGIIISLLPILHNTPTSNVIHPLWLIIFICQYIPGSGSNVYKELKLVNENISSTWLNGWIVIFQIVLGILTIPTIFLPLPYPAEKININEFGKYVKDAMLCLNGINTRENDNCEDALIFFIISIILNVIFNIFLLKLLRKSGATNYLILGSFKIPITSLLGLSTTLQGRGYETEINIEFILSLIILVIGVILYSINGEEKKNILEIDNHPLLGENEKNQEIIEMK